MRFVVKMYPYKYRHFSFISAEAALDARDQGKFWEMHWKIHEGFPKLDRESLIRYAEEIGLDVARFTQYLDSKKHQKDLDRDVQLAKDLDLYNTPAFFINGRKVLGNRPYESYKKIIDEELDLAEAANR